MNRTAFRCIVALVVALPAFASAQVVRVPVPVPVTPMPGGNFPRLPIPTLSGSFLPPARLPGPIPMPAAEYLPNPATVIPVLSMERMLPILRKAYGLQAAPAAAVSAPAAPRKVAELRTPAAAQVDGMLRTLRRSFDMDETEPAARPTAEGTDRMFDGGSKPSKQEPSVPVPGPRPSRRGGMQSLPEWDLEEEIGSR